MLKLVRNALRDLRNIISPKGKSISWDYFARLYSLQQQDGYWLNTFFIVADLLEFLELDHDLEDPKCSSTIEFIHNIHRIFDILNSRHASVEAGFFTSN